MTERVAPTIWGHRGARGLYPENTLDGFRRTLADGVTHLELDVAVTADGVPVVHHDPALTPETTRDRSGQWLTERGPLIRSLTFAQLRDYDVGRIRPGSAMAARFPDQQPIDGAAIPTLEDALRLPAEHVLVELKLFPAHRGWTVSPAAMVRAVLGAADRAGARDRITLQSFDWRAVREAQAQAPDLLVALLTEPETEAEPELWWDREPATSVPRAVMEEGAGTWAACQAGLTREQVDEAHDLGLRVVPWTVNDPDTMARLAEWGVDGLITDRPDLARQVLER